MSLFVANFIVMTTMGEKGADKKTEVLIVDDNMVEIILFKEAMKWAEIPAKINMVSDGVQAMQLLAQLDGNLPDLIFLDINMPRKDGKQCLVEIRNDKKFQNTPVIMFTTTDDPREIDETYKKGANLFVTKPYSIDTLKTLLKKIFSLDWREYLPHPAKDKYVLREE